MAFTGAGAGNGWGTGIGAGNRFDVGPLPEAAGETLREVGNGNAMEDCFRSVQRVPSPA